MRNKRKNDILSQMAERDLASFLPLCGEADKKFFDPSCKGREAEEYVRLTLIATALGRRGVVVYLLGEAEYESKDDEVMRCLASVKNDYRTVVNWIEDFIGEIRGAAGQASRRGTVECEEKRPQ